MSEVSKKEWFTISGKVFLSLNIEIACGDIDDFKCALSNCLHSLNKNTDHYIDDNQDNIKFICDKPQDGDCK